MSSRFFPYHPKHEPCGKRLVDAKRLINEVVSDWMDARIYLNGDEQADDQSDIDQLEKAITCIDSCLELDSEDPVAVAAELKKVNDAIRWNSSKREELERMLAKTEAK